MGVFEALAGVSRDLHYRNRTGADWVLRGFYLRSGLGEKNPLLSGSMMLGLFAIFGFFFRALRCSALLCAFHGGLFASTVFVACVLGCRKCSFRLFSFWLRFCCCGFVKVGEVYEGGF